MKKILRSRGIVLGVAISFLVGICAHADWSQSAKVLVTGGVADEGVGTKVDISGSYAIAGVVGFGEDRAHFLTNSGGTWQYMQTVTTGTASGYFGENVAISGDYALVSDYNDSGAAGQAGAVFAYKRTGATWNETQKFVSSDIAGQDFFGDEIAMAGSYAVVGAYREDQDANGANTLSAAGSAYLFTRTGDT